MKLTYLGIVLRLGIRGSWTLSYTYTAWRLIKYMENCIFISKIIQFLFKLTLTLKFSFVFRLLFIIIFLLSLLHFILFFFLCVSILDLSESSSFYSSFWPVSCLSFIFSPSPSVIAATLRPLVQSVTESNSAG